MQDLCSHCVHEDVCDDACDSCWDCGDFEQAQESIVTARIEEE